MGNGDNFDEETKKQIYSDIYDDSMWLINLVENLLLCLFAPGGGGKASRLPARP